MNKSAIVRRVSIILAVMLLLCPLASAHSGRTDSSGGHKDNQNKSGLGYYHYHHGYPPHLHPNGVCQYESATSTQPAATTTAAPQPTYTQLSYPGVSIFINGQYLTPLDVNGNIVDPFVLNGTTYVPVRAIASALGLYVDWDGDTNTIFLTSGAQASVRGYVNTAEPRTVKKQLSTQNIKILLDGVKLSLKDANGVAVDVISFDGTTYLPIRAIASALGIDVDWVGETNTVILVS